MDNSPGITALDATSFTVSACWNYQTESGGWARQRWIAYYVYEQHWYGDSVDAYGLTDSTGCFTSAAISRNGQTIYVKFVLDNGAARVGSIDFLGNFNDLFWNTGTINTGSDYRDNYDFGNNYPVGNEPFTRIFKYMMDAWDFGMNSMDYRSGGYDIGQVSVTTETPGCTVSAYYRDSHTIKVCMNGVDEKSPDDMKHEYGHYFMHKAYHDAWPSPGGSHSFCTSEDRGLAWAEGWSDWYGPIATKWIADWNHNSYMRPYDGSSFSINMGTLYCTGHSGDGDEMNVAQSLWGLIKSYNEALWRVKNVIRDCYSANFNEYFNAGCSWASDGFSTNNFVRASWADGIDYDVTPTATTTSQTTFQWLRGAITISGSGSAQYTTITRLDFGLSSYSGCTYVPTVGGSTTSNPGSISYDTHSWSDTSWVYSCTRATDGMKTSGWAQSPSAFGIDNTAPTGSVSVPGTTGPGSFSVSWSTSDGMSGVSSVYLYERPPGSVSFNQVCSSTSSAGSCTRAPPSTAVGTYTYHAIVYDRAGNAYTTGDASTVFI